MCTGCISFNYITAHTIYKCTMTSTSLWSLMGGGLFKFVITDLIDQMSSKPQGSTWIHLPKYWITGAHHHNHFLIFILCPICFAGWEIEYRSLAMLWRQCVTEVYLQFSVTSTKTFQIYNPVWRQQITQGCIRTQMYSGTLKYCM